MPVYFNEAGERIVVESLLPVATDPHSFQPVSPNIVQISESDALILNGMEYESFIDPIHENIEGKRVMIEAAAGLEVLKMAEDAYEGEDH